MRLLMGVMLSTAAVGQAQLPNNPQPAPAQRSPHSVLPNAPYVPLSSRQKFHTFLKQTYSPYTFLSVMYSATYAQMTGEPYEYGGGMEGYGKRLGASLADTEASRFFNRFLFPVMFHQDPRYFPAKPNAGFFGRAWYAATRVAITRADSGKSQFNYSEVFGDLFTVSLENAYFPRRQRGFGDTLSRFAGALISDVGTNETREFWPDIKRIFRRHEPKRVQEMQQRIEKKIPPSMKPQNDE